MKKTLLAAALLAGFAGAASAQSSVTMYGLLDGGLRYNTVSLGNNTSASNFGLAYGNQSGNRLGFRGVEDIGGGNQVIFNLEAAVGLGSNSALSFGRQAWLGLQNKSWGDIKMGRTTNFATDYVGVPVDPFGTGFGQLNMGRAFGVANTDRVSNMLKYQTPNMSGFQAGLAYSFATGNTAAYTAAAGGGTGTTGYNFITANNSRQLSLGAKYANGPVYVAASYDKIFGEQSKGQNASISSWNIAGTYDLKVVKLAAGYGQTRDGVVLGAGGGGTGATIAGNSLGQNGELVFAPAVGTNSYIVGATVPVNPVSRVLLSWTMLTPNTNMKDAYNAQNQTAYNLAYVYDFTKRTNMYGFFGYMTNVATIDTAKSTLVGIGLRHQF